MNKEKITLYPEKMNFYSPEGEGEFPLPYGEKNFDCIHVIGTIETTQGGGAWLLCPDKLSKHLSAAPVVPKIDAYFFGASLTVDNTREGDKEFPGLQFGRLEGFWGRNIRVKIEAELILSNRELRYLLVQEISYSASNEAEYEQGSLSITRIDGLNDKRLSWIQEEYVSRVHHDIIIDLDVMNNYKNNFSFYNHYVEAKSGRTFEKFIGFDNFRIIKADEEGIQVVSFDHLDESMWIPGAGWYLFYHPIPSGDSID